MGKREQTKANVRRVFHMVWRTILVDLDKSLVLALFLAPAQRLTSTSDEGYMYVLSANPTPASTERLENLCFSKKRPAPVTSFQCMVLY